MYQSRSNDENLRDANSLSNITGMATLKAFSIFSFPFLFSQVWSEKLSDVKEQTHEAQDGIIAIKADTLESNVDNKLQEDAPILSKAQGMIQHLKHTKKN